MKTTTSVVVFIISLSFLYLFSICVRLIYSSLGPGLVVYGVKTLPLTSKEAGSTPAGSTAKKNPLNSGWFFCSHRKRAMAGDMVQFYS